MKKIAIATMSQEKIEGIKKVFCTFFGFSEFDLDLICKKTKSNVSEQPFNNDTYLGALNRVNNLKEELKIANYDYIVSCEAGIESFCKDLYFSVQVVCIYDTTTKKYLYGKSSGWQIPAKDIEIVRASSLDSYMKSKNINSLEQLLLGTTRSDHVCEATKNALCMIEKM